MAEDDDRQMRGDKPLGDMTPGLDSWSFLDEREEPERQRQRVSVDANGEMALERGREAGRRTAALMEERSRERENQGWLDSVSSFAQSFAGVSSKNAEDEAAEDVASGGAEKVGGAPNDHWRQCATSQMAQPVIDDPGSFGTCECNGGEVRFGSDKLHIWTLPVEMGENANVECSMDGLRKLRVHLPTHSGAEMSRQCQCIEREVRISSMQVGKTTSFAQRRERENDAGITDAMSDIASSSGGDGPAPCGLYPGVECKVCLWVPPEADLSFAQRSSLAETGRYGESNDAIQHMMMDELATSVHLKACDDEDSEQVFTFLQSTGQIRSAQTGKCVGVYFDHRDGGGKPTLRAFDCNENAESQDLTQRWFVPHYTGDNFESGQGKIELAYGQHSTNPLCLDALNTDELEVRDCGSTTTQWLFESDTGVHKWQKCEPSAQEQGTCACAGEVRFGMGELNKWTSPVAIHNTGRFVPEIQCDLGILRTMAIHDPVAKGTEDQHDPKARHCQCRGAKTPDGTPVKEDAASSMPLVLGGVVGLAVAGGAGYLIVQSRKRNALYSEYEEEEYEEEYENEEYEE